MADDRLMVPRALTAPGLPTVPSGYVNTIPGSAGPPFPGDAAIEARIEQYVRWNAVAMVLRAGATDATLGGHLATFASAATLYEIGFQHFFRGKGHPGGGDQVFFQAHAAPGIYARAYLEGRLSEDDLGYYRRESQHHDGLSAYPHPRLMPRFWEFPTASMGLTAMEAIHQARFNRYLHDRGLKDTREQRVWAFLGDGEMDEPESVGALHRAAYEELDNITFVVNCNLQRLDGPVRGNGKIIQQLEALFQGAGWAVIKVIWSGAWDPIFARDTSGDLVRKLGALVDGEFQRHLMEDGDFLRRQVFGPERDLQRLVEHYSDDDLTRLHRGGHDRNKVFEAYDMATKVKGGPVAVLCKTVKGWELGSAIAGRNAAHQMRRMNRNDLLGFAQALELEDVLAGQLVDAVPPYFRPDPESAEARYLHARRRALGGYIPDRSAYAAPPRVPGHALYDAAVRHGDAPSRQVSTTSVLVRLLRDLMRTPDLGARIVPIVPDEARTFGLESLFREFGIYSPSGQLYTPTDAGMQFEYTERRGGQIMQEGVSEANAMASCLASGTSYSVHGQVSLPFFFFYSMFGFQRVGDLVWAFSDACGRGFLIGCVAGRTTLNGEGLQHQDGHSQLLASAFPSCLAYDPAYAYEVAAIVRSGVDRMTEGGADVFYYVTAYNEKYVMPPQPDGSEDGILAGMYRLLPPAGGGRAEAHLLGSGAVLATEVVRAQELLRSDFNVPADVWSVTSYKLLCENGLEVDRWNRLHPEDAPRLPYLRRAMIGSEAPVIATSDWVKAVPMQIAPWMASTFVPLGTDGYGRSDSRTSLRRHFEVDAEHIVVATLSALQAEGVVKPRLVSEAIARYGINPEKEDPRGA